MAIVRQTDKRSGITYAYESISFWHKEKRQSRSKRTLIGRVDPITGEILPTNGRMRKRIPNKPSPLTSDTESFAPYARRFYGATYLLDQIGDKIGITDDLKHCFPDTYKQILSIAYYLILEDKNPLYRFEKWSIIHKHPYEQNISSQRSSELFMSIKDDSIQKFFRLQGKRTVSFNSQ